MKNNCTLILTTYFKVYFIDNIFLFSILTVIFAQMVQI